MIWFVWSLEGTRLHIANFFWFLLKRVLYTWCTGLLGLWVFKNQTRTAFMLFHFSWLITHVFWILHEILASEDFAAKSLDIIIMMVHATGVIPLGMIFQTCLVVHWIQIKSSDSIRYSKVYHIISIISYYHSSVHWLVTPPSISTPNGFTMFHRLNPVT